MTEEDKQLLTIDLCARLPYHYLNVKYGNEDYNIIDVGFGRVTLIKPFMSCTSGAPLIEEVKPYLRSKSSMTEEEQYEYLDLIVPVNDAKAVVEEEKVPKVIDFYHKHFIDYRGMIEKDLAIEAPEDMYKLYIS